MKIMILLAAALTAFAAHADRGTSQLFNAGKNLSVLTIAGSTAETLYKYLRIPEVVDVTDSSLRVKVGKEGRLKCVTSGTTYSCQLFIYPYHGDILPAWNNQGGAL